MKDWAPADEAVDASQMATQINGNSNAGRVFVGLVTSMVRGRGQI